jgi:hypothetical protein
LFSQSVKSSRSIRSCSSSSTTLLALESADFSGSEDVVGEGVVDWRRRFSRARMKRRRSERTVDGESERQSTC